MTTPVFDAFNAAADSRMRYIQEALSPAKAQSVLAAACGRRVRIAAIRVVRHKPERRCLIEYDLIDASGEFTAIGKMRAKGLSTDVVRLMHELRRAGFDDDSADGISVPEPLGVAPQWNMWLQRKVVGDSASQIIGRPQGVGIARRVGQALQKLHALNLHTVRSHSIADEYAILDGQLRNLGLQHPNLAGRLRRLSDLCLRLSQSMQTFPPTGIHRDFYPAQVHMAGRRLYLLDFDLFTKGDPALDAGNFIGHLTEQSVRELGDTDGLSEHEISIEEAFVAHHGEQSRSNVRAFALLTLARLVAISDRFPERRPFTERLLDICTDRLVDDWVQPRFRVQLTVA
jgi:hypothetical protein